MRIFLAVAVAVAVFVTASGASEPAKARRLVAAGPIAGAPEGAQAYRVVYHSADAGAKAIDVTDVVIIPAGDPPAAGRDIVAWAHGTSGIADDCAPSTNSWLFSSIAGLANLLRHGYIVAATYQGLDGLGPHPYMKRKLLRTSQRFQTSSTICLDSGLNMSETSRSRREGPVPTILDPVPAAVSDG